MVVKEQENRIVTTLQNFISSMEPVVICQTEALLGIVTANTEVGGNQWTTWIFCLKLSQFFLHSQFHIFRKRKPFLYLRPVFPEILAGNKMPFHQGVFWNGKSRWLIISSAFLKRRFLPGMSDRCWEFR